MTSIATPSGRRGPTEDAAAERLYAEYSDRLLAFCVRQLGSRAEAEDAVQITFLCALRALRRGVVPESESAWLHAIARNVCRWQQRTASRRPLDGAVDLESVASAASDDDTELLGGLRDALESLPDRQRHALLLREWRGLSAHEIAEHLHLSPPATHALLTRARRALAHALTAPQRAAVGLASLVYEFRSWIKAVLGGASAKAAAVATVAVVGAGTAGVVAVDRSLAGDRSSREPVEVAQPIAAAPIAARARARDADGRSISRKPDAASSAGRTSRDAGRSSVSGRLPSVESALTPLGPRRPRTSPAADPAPAPGPERAPREPDSPLTDPLAAVPVEPPPLPELPPVDLPPVDLPPVDLPPVDLPPVDLPPADLPTDVLPPVDVPPVDVPPVDPPPLPKLP